MLLLVASLRPKSISARPGLSGLCRACMHECSDILTAASSIRRALANTCMCTPCALGNQLLPSEKPRARILPAMGELPRASLVAHGFVAHRSPAVMCPITTAPPSITCALFGFESSAAHAGFAKQSGRLPAGRFAVSTMSQKDPPPPARHGSLLEHFKKVAAPDFAAGFNSLPNVEIKATEAPESYDEVAAEDTLAPPSPRSVCEHPWRPPLPFF